MRPKHETLKTKHPYWPKAMRPKHETLKTKHPIGRRQRAPNTKHDTLNTPIGFELLQVIGYPAQERPAQHTVHHAVVVRQ